MNITKAKEESKVKERENLGVIIKRNLPSKKKKRVKEALLNISKKAKKKSIKLKVKE